LMAAKHDIERELLAVMAGPDGEFAHGAGVLNGWMISRP
jgi:hypothetical protein